MLKLDLLLRLVMRYMQVPTFYNTSIVALSSCAIREKKRSKG